MERYTGREALLQILESEGVEYVFGNPGTTELPLMDALAGHPRLKYVLGLGEAAAMAMADGYSRASGKLSVANFHGPPGLGNAIGALYNAHFFGAPVLVTAGQREHAFGITDPTLFGDLVSIARPVVKYAIEINAPAELPLLVRRAAKIALTPPVGPVFVSLPVDVLMGEAEMALGAPTRPLTAHCPARETLLALAEKLLAAENPVIVSGPEVFKEDAFTALAEVASLCGAKVYGQTVPSLAVFPTAHPLYMGDLHRDARTARSRLEGHDLVFMAGGDGMKVSTYLPGGPLPPGTALVELAQGEWDLGKNYPADLSIRGGVRVTLEALIPLLAEGRSEAQANRADTRARACTEHNWSSQQKALVRDYSALSSLSPIRGDFLALAIVEALPDDGVIVEEAPTTCRNLLKLLPVTGRQRFYGPASGGIGWGMPAALGVQLALPDQPVVAVIGDGSAMYSNQALWTAVHLNLPVTFIIANNRTYGIVKERMIAMKGEAVANENLLGMDIQHPNLDFIHLAKSMGLSASRVEDPAALPQALRDAIATRSPCLLEVALHDGSLG